MILALQRKTVLFFVLFPCFLSSFAFLPFFSNRNATGQELAKRMSAMERLQQN
jgi:hypothetical protein